MACTSGTFDSCNNTSLSSFHSCRKWSPEVLNSLIKVTEGWNSREAGLQAQIHRDQSSETSPAPLHRPRLRTWDPADVGPWTLLVWSSQWTELTFVLVTGITWRVCLLSKWRILNKTVNVIFPQALYCEILLTHGILKEEQHYIIYLDWTAGDILPHLIYSINFFQNSLRVSCRHQNTSLLNTILRHVISSEQECSIER